jgi:hypothetical protein
MIEIEDWLQDPLRKIDNNTYKTRTLKAPKDRQQEKWFSFHFATRLKLEEAVFFCRQVLGAASMPEDLGLPLLAHRQIEWYLEAFFFELMSAYDTLLQELNIIYAYDLSLKPDQVRWNEEKPNKLMKTLPDSILKYITKEKKWTGLKKFRDIGIQRHINIPFH